MSDRDQLSPEDIRLGTSYEAVRGEVRRQVAELKRHRRVTLGDRLELVFENRETIRSAVEELVRAEHVTDPEQIAADVDAFNAVIPKPGSLGAMLFMEVLDPADLTEAAVELQGVAACLYIDVGGTRAAGVPEVVNPPDEAEPAVFVSFPLSSEQRQAWKGGAEVVAGVEHPAASARVALAEEQRSAIAAEL